MGLTEGGNLPKGGSVSWSLLEPSWRLLEPSWRLLEPFRCLLVSLVAASGLLLLCFRGF